MIVSFDLDGVLFVDPVKYEIEQPLRYPFNRFYPDRLRKGTVDLIHRLKNEKFQVWVYTSSYRRERYIKGIFWHYHVKFDKIINGTRHDREVQRNRKQRLPSKLPSFYRISLHIDDEESVMKNGQTYGFRVLRVSEPDPLWAEKVLQEAIRIREIENRGKQYLLFRSCFQSVLFQSAQIDAVNDRRHHRYPDIDAVHDAAFRAKQRKHVDHGMYYNTRKQTAAFVKRHRQHKSPAYRKNHLQGCFKPALSGEQIDDMSDPECQRNDCHRHRRLILRKHRPEQEPAEYHFLNKTDKDHGYHSNHQLCAAIGKRKPIPEITRREDEHRKKIKIAFHILWPAGKSVFLFKMVPLYK